MSDSYLGLDQQYDIRLDVIPAPETAVNGVSDDYQFVWQSVFNWWLTSESDCLDYIHVG